MDAYLPQSVSWFVVLRRDINQRAANRRKTELSDFLAPVAQHTGGLALPMPAVAAPSRRLLPVGIEALAWDVRCYETSVPDFRGPPFSLLIPSVDPSS